MLIICIPNTSSKSFTLTLIIAVTPRGQWVNASDKDHALPLVITNIAKALAIWEPFQYRHVKFSFMNTPDKDRMILQESDIYNFWTREHFFFFFKWDPGLSHCRLLNELMKHNWVAIMAPWHENALRMKGIHRSSMGSLTKGPLVIFLCC